MPDGDDILSATSFYLGILYALLVLKTFDEPTMTDEIINGLGKSEQKGLIRFAKKNGDYELSGLKQWDDEHATAPDGARK